MFSASSIVSGNLVPSVSGKKIAERPARNATDPNVKSGKYGEIILKRGIKGASKAPDLDSVESVPMTPLLIRVGSISAVE